MACAWPQRSRGAVSEKKTCSLVRKTLARGATAFINH
jgi:hypothetical protein